VAGYLSHFTFTSTTGSLLLFTSSFLSRICSGSTLLHRVLRLESQGILSILHPLSSEGQAFSGSPTSSPLTACSFFYAHFCPGTHGGDGKSTPRRRTPSPAQGFQEGIDRFWSSERRKLRCAKVIPLAKTSWQLFEKKGSVYVEIESDIYNSTN